MASRILARSKALPLVAALSRSSADAAQPLAGARALSSLPRHPAVTLPPLGIGQVLAYRPRSHFSGTQVLPRWFSTVPSNGSPTQTSQKSESRKFIVMSFLRLLPQRLPQLVRQMEQDVETVIHVLQPGPIGIVEHKFTDAEILEARTTVRRAVDNWRTNSTLERNLGSVSFDK